MLDKAAAALRLLLAVLTAVMVTPLRATDPRRPDRRPRAILAMFLVVVTLSVAGWRTVQAGVVLGASFGYTHVSYPDVSDVTNNVVGIPAREMWGQPGVRLGYVAPEGHWDLNADIGLDYSQLKPSSGSGVTEASVELLPQIQANLPGSGGFTPFVNGGVGIEHETTYFSGSVSGTRPAFGAGVGVRKSVSDGHGILRVEFRYDYLPKVVKEQGPFSTFTFLARNMLSLKLGFDLVFAR